MFVPTITVCFFLFTKKYVCSRQLQDSEDELDQLGQQREKGPGFITESHGARKHRERGGRRKKKKLKLLLLTFLFPLGFIFRFFFFPSDSTSSVFLTCVPHFHFSSKTKFTFFFLSPHSTSRHFKGRLTAAFFLLLRLFNGGSEVSQLFGDFK